MYSGVYIYPTVDIVCVCVCMYVHTDNAGCHVPGARSTLGDDNKTLEIEARLTANMSHALDNTGKHLWLNFHCWNVPPGDARCAAYGDSFRIYDDHHDSWNSTRRTIQYMSSYRQAWWGADPGKGWPDPDFVFTGGQGCSATAPTDPSAPAPLCPQQSETEYTTEFSMWALAGGQIVSLCRSCATSQDTIQMQVYERSYITDGRM